MKAKIYVGAKKYALYIGRKIVQKTLEFLTLPARFVSKKVQDLKNLTMYGQSVQNGIPTPTAPIEIESVGDRTKNLFGDYILQKWILASGTITYNTRTACLSTNYLDVKAGESYTLSVTPTEYNLNVVAVNWFDENLNFINRESSTATSLTVTVPSNAKKALIGFSAKDFEGNITDEIVQSFNTVFNKGSTPLPYEPYGYKVPVTIDNTTTNIYLNEPLRKIGEYADTLSVDGTEITVIRNIGNIIFNGSEDWNVNYTGFFSMPFTNYIPASYSMSSHFEGVDTGVIPPIDIPNSRENKVWLGSAWLGLGARARFATVIDFKNWLNNNNVEVVYQLATPTTETYTIDNPINLPQGTLTIDTDTILKPSKINITGDIDNE